MLRKWQRGTVALTVVWLIGSGVYACIDDLNAFSATEQTEQNACDQTYGLRPVPNYEAQKNCYVLKAGPARFDAVPDRFRPIEECAGQVAYSACRNVAILQRNMRHSRPDWTRQYKKTGATFKR